MRLVTLQESEILITLIALSLLLFSAFVFGSLIEKIKGPRVVGEIIGGMILGGSCLFLLFPAFMKNIFFAYPEEGKVLNIFYQLGLIFLMFLSGYNTDIEIDKKNSKTNISYLENFVFSFFVPIYFALVGIQLNVIHDFSIIRFILFFIVAFGLEFIGTYLLLLFSNLKKNIRMSFAITMNARGGPGIVLATVAYASNIISLEFFTVLILTTMLSSMIAGYYLRGEQKKNPKVFNELTER